MHEMIKSCLGVEKIMFLVKTEWSEIHGKKNVTKTVYFENRDGKTYKIIPLRFENLPGQVQFLLEMSRQVLFL